MRARKSFLKQKLFLYFDENFPTAVVNHFMSARRWRKKVSITTAVERGNLGKPDRFHYSYCQKYRLVLVTLDRDFDDDQAYPFGFGSMCGIIMIRASSASVVQITDILTRILIFLTRIPFQRSFLLETKFIASRDGVIMRGRDADTKEIKSLSVTAGETTISEIRRFFHY